MRDNNCLLKFVNIANVCIDLGHWPSHFKTSTTIIIPKPNKFAYDSPKLYWLIILLNTIGKLFKKMIGEWLQFHIISNNFIHQSQLGGLKQKSTTDASIVLTHTICSGWIKNFITSALAFNIAQFFPSLNHQLLPLILNKVGLDHKVFNFFKNYLVGRKTQYCQNDFISSSFNINVGVGQGSALSPILSALYLSPVFHSLEKHLKNLKIPISLISFVDDGLFVSQNNSILHSNVNLFCSDNIMSSLFSKFSLIIEHDKTDVFHSSRAHGAFNPPLLNLSSIRGPLCYGMLWTWTILFSFSFIFWLYRDFVFFFFSFGRWRGMWHRSHMTGHMMWCHKPKTW